MNRFKTPVLFAICFVFLTNCNQSKYYYSPRPASSADAGLSLFGEPGSKAYQSAVIAQLAKRSPTDFRYFFEAFLEENDQTYMMTNFNDGQASFLVKILVDRIDQQAVVKWANKQRTTKELPALDWNIKKVAGRQEIVYIDIRNVID